MNHREQREADTRQANLLREREEIAQRRAKEERNRLGAHEAPASSNVPVANPLEGPELSRCPFSL